MNTRVVVSVLGSLVATCLLAHDGCAQGRLGFGLVLGEPTGVAWKYRIDHVHAVDGAIGFSPFDNPRINIDYLWHSHPFDESLLALHYGIGAAFGFGRTDVVLVRGNNGTLFQREELGFGMRGVLGLTYTIPRSPLDVFFEMAPILVFTPGTGMGIDIGLGARVYP